MDLEVTLEELFHGNIREIEFTRLVFNEESSTLTEERVVKEIHIQPGWSASTQVVYEKEGNQAKDKIPSDVVVQVVEVPHDRFVREGSDLRMKIAVYKNGFKFKSFSSFLHIDRWTYWWLYVEATSPSLASTISLSVSKKPTSSNPEVPE